LVSFFGFHYEVDLTKWLFRHQLYWNLLIPVIAYFIKSFWNLRPLLRLKSVKNEDTIVFIAPKNLL
jgi:hypothetical protein